MASEPNRITIYSSGMADFVRSFAVPQGGEETSVSIPFKQDHIADVLASLKVYGRVRLYRPPSFTPDNTHASTLPIRPTHAQQDLLTHLSGAEIKVVARGGAPAIEGRLLGLDRRRRSTAAGKVEELVVSVLTSGAVRKLTLDDVESFEFTDEKVRAEIKKALDANFQKIKTGSTFLELGLLAAEGTEGDQEALVQYMVPTAAWKSSYRISTRNGQNAGLEMLAIVDNNTDEDWDNFLIAVATGQPISFSTDLATVRTPSRTHVNLVQNEALGAVDVAEGYGGGVEGLMAPMMARSLEGRSVSASPPRGAMAMASSIRGGERDRDDEVQAAAMSLGDFEMDHGQARRDEAESSEVGDFQIFRSKTPLSIPAKKSALVPIFSTEVPDCQLILVYKPKAHPTRPFRAVKFTNTTGVSLGKGVCSVFAEAVNVGEGILEECKPDESKVIPHQLETGVRVIVERSPVETRVNHIRIARGNYLSEVANTSRARFVVHNKKEEEFRIFLEHDSVLGPGAELEVAFDGRRDGWTRETIPGGWRIALTLGSREEVSLGVTETRRTDQRVVLDENNFQYYLNASGALVKNPQVRAALKIEEQIRDHEGRVMEAKAERDVHLALAKRVTGYVEKAPEGEQRNAWLKDIAQAETEIRKVDRDRLPALNAALKGLREKLRDAITAIVADWNWKTDPEPVQG